MVWRHYTSLPYSLTSPERVESPTDTKMNPLIRVGDKLEEWQIKNEEGHTIQFDWKQPRILFFINGCGECSKPKLTAVNEIAKRLPAKSIVAVSMGDVATARAVTPLFPNVKICVDDKKILAKRVGVQFLPQVVLIGEKGKVLYAQPDNQDWLTALKSAVKTLEGKGAKP